MFTITVWAEFNQQTQRFDHFLDGEGKLNVLCLNDWLNSLINDQWYKGRKVNNVDEAERIVIQATKTMFGQIWCTSFDMDTYPAALN